MTIKKTTAFAVILMMSVAAFGQKSKRTSANNYLEYRELDNAKEAIDPTITHEKTMNDAKTWYFRGKIYQAIHETKDPKYQTLHETPLKVAYESFKRCKELDEKDYYTNEINSRFLNAQAIHFFNLGVTSLKKEDFQNGKEYFSNALEIGQEPYSTLLHDTLKMSSMYYLGVCNEALEDYEGAEKALLKAAEMAKALDQPEHMGAFGKLSNMYRKLKNTEKQLEIIKLGRKSLGDETAFIIDEANIFLGNGETDKALVPLKKAVEADPGNFSALFALGSITEQLAKKKDESATDAESLKMFEEARAAYRKSIEQSDLAIAKLDKSKPSYENELKAINTTKFDATYSLGASYFNVGVKKNEAANQIDDMKKFEAARDKADAVFDQALPMLEKAYELNPDDPQLLVSLKQLYYRKMAKDDSYTKKYEEVMARIKG